MQHKAIVVIQQLIIAPIYYTKSHSLGKSDTIKVYSSRALVLASGCYFRNVHAGIFALKKARASGRNVGKVFNPVLKLVFENYPFLSKYTIDCSFKYKGCVIVSCVAIYSHAPVWI